MDNSYMFELNYGKRTEYKKFIIEITKIFERQILNADLAISNNPYNLEFYFYIRIKDDEKLLESWLKENYPHILKRKNWFFYDIIHSMKKKGYNIFPIDSWSVDMVITKECNDFFHFDVEELYRKIWGSGIKKFKNQVFLCHNSKDKHVVDTIYDKFQKTQINCFYDKYEIMAGDDIRSFINKNIERSSFCILCISNNLNTRNSDWIRSEVEYFKSNNIRIIPINLDVEENEIIKQAGGIRFINYKNENYFDEIIHTIKKYQFE